MKYKIDYDSPETVKNWITSMDLVCEESFQIGMFGSLYFIGLFLGSAVFVRLADLKGRKIFVQIGVTGTMFCTIIIYLVNNLTIVYLSIAAFGLFLALRIFISYIYLLELAHLRV